MKILIITLLAALALPTEARAGIWIDEDGINYDPIKSTNLIAGIKFNF